MFLIERLRVHPFVLADEQSRRLSSLEEVWPVPSMEEGWHVLAQMVVMHSVQEITRLVVVLARDYQTVVVPFADHDQMLFDLAC